ncbi:hypothetical protein C7999DRAFT_17142, partial [Corynascus novoguineensis]
FQLWHISGGDRHIDPAECYDDFRKGVAGCSRGGRSRYSNWEYKCVSPFHPLWPLVVWFPSLMFHENVVFLLYSPGVCLATTTADDAAYFSID